MADYTFETLNDKEFEYLANDLFEHFSGEFVERFKPGKDAGIDGRFYIDGCASIIQSKHWLKSGVSKLLKEFEKNEVIKVKKINPEKYVVFTSLPLSPSDKDKIKDIFDPYIKSTTDIFGKDDINKLLDLFPDVERNHNKLWLSSTNVLEIILHRAQFNRSGYIVEQALDEKQYYVVTSNHCNALDHLEQKHAIIITGEPGVGKTTLAEQICLNYVADGYDFISLSDSIDEAYDLICKSKKQIFYFDDFLGSNYLMALRNNEDSKIVRFIKIIRGSEYSRFVLTSRTSIFNQGKVLGNNFISSNISRNEYELKADMLSYVEKAKILYNRIWHSDLPVKYCESILKDKKYHTIIKHSNYNPRLIEYLTDPFKIENVDSSRYWDHITNVLCNPRDVWHHPFVTQLDDISRAVVLLVVFKGNEIFSDELEFAFARYSSFVSLESKSNLALNLDNTLKILVKSFLNKYFDHGEILFKIQNPSIADYVLNYVKDEKILVDIVTSLRDATAVNVLSKLSINDSVCGNVTLKALQCDSFNIESEGHFNYIIRLAYECANVNVDLSTLYDRLMSLIVESCDWNHNVNHFLLRVIYNIELTGYAFSSNFYSEFYDLFVGNNVDNYLEIYDFEILLDIYELSTNFKHVVEKDEIASQVIAFLEHNIFELVDEFFHVNYINSETTEDQIEEALLLSLKDYISILNIEIDEVDLFEPLAWLDYKDVIDKYRG